MTPRRSSNDPFDPARQLGLGADPLPDGGVHFRVWAPKRRRVEVVLESGPGAPHSIPLQAAAEGFHEAMVAEAAPGTDYRYRLDGEMLCPDPASRFQPQGPHGPSRVVDSFAYRWDDVGWTGIEPHGQIIYELHIGTFTAAGTWSAATEALQELADLGITAIELMPVAEFAGRFGWGYDGVDLFAPYHHYGLPDDFRRFVDRAHGLGIGVILDVVYNHLGPDGNYLQQFSDSYFTDRYETDWGEPLNFHGPGSAPVREFFIANAAYWIREYHIDGLRLDATQDIYDVGAGPQHVIADITRAARAAAGNRSVMLIAENEPQNASLVRSTERSGMGMDALWNDDFHHSAIVALTGRAEAYYQDYLGVPQEFVSSARWGFLYQGQHYAWQGKRRGQPALDLPPSAFVDYIQNHDQIANSGRGDRIHKLTSPARLRAMTSLLLLGPHTPLLFMGQEFAASTPFLYFADHQPELARSVREGRREFLLQFPSLEGADLADPAAETTFRQSQLDRTDRERHAEVYAMHRDLILLRRTDPVLSQKGEQGPAGAVLGASAFVLRYFGGSCGDRLLLVNFGREMHFSPAPEPLLAPLTNSGWEVVWSSEDPRYGGSGAPDPETSAGGWHIAAECSMLLKPSGADRSSPHDQD